MTVERKAVRSRVLYGATLLHGTTHMSVDCMVRDLSDSGARARLADDIILEPPMILVIHKLVRAFEAEAAWRRRGEVGLRFVQSYNLDSPKSDLERSLRRLALTREFSNPLP